jgi:hypothetical protein
MSDTAFQSIPIFGNTNPIVTDAQISGEGFRILWLSSPLDNTTRVYKYYKKGKFDQTTVGNSAKVANTFEYKAVWAIIRIPYNAARTLPTTEMNILVDLSTVANATAITALPEVIWRGAAA